VTGKDHSLSRRAAFVTGQSPDPLGLTKGGLPGADLELEAEDATIAEVLSRKATPQVNLARTIWAMRRIPANRARIREILAIYQNAEQLQCPDYPKNPEFRKKFGPYPRCRQICASRNFAPNTAYAGGQPRSL